ncbi:MAG: hypothetical protein LUC85_01165 [Bacteroidales bacterium]|nr:hypothetical protein [Bacteroidales bacterium]
MKRSTLIPSLLVLYLGVMSWIGYPAYASGEYSALYYFGIIGATLLVIALLAYHLRRRERERGRGR